VAARKEILTKYDYTNCNYWGGAMLTPGVHSKGNAARSWGNPRQQRQISPQDQSPHSVPTPHARTTHPSSSRQLKLSWHRETSPTKRIWRNGDLTIRNDDAESFEFFAELLMRFRRRIVMVDPAGLSEDSDCVGEQG
jgi:hypothetical protein